MGKKVVVIGSGFSGLSAASFLAKAGFDVTILEKNDTPGGRAREFKEAGFTFDMGPSWYWMPDVFDRYFNQFNYNTSDFYKLKRLDPSYRVTFSAEDSIDIPSSYDELLGLFDQYEAGAGNKLHKFMEQAGYKYKVGMNDLVFRPSKSITEFASLRLLYDITRMDIFKSFSSHLNKYVSHPQLKRIMEFPILLLGALPENTPALYSLMNYADMKLGTWFPMGGMHQIIQGMVRLANELGVRIEYNQEVTRIETRGSKVSHVHAANVYEADIVVGGADYHHIETKLLAPDKRNYNDKYWDKRVMAPSSLLYYVGVNKKLSGLLHHTLFFDYEFRPHAEAIYDNPSWPENPLFYVSATTKTDPSLAPEGHENIFILIPVASGLKDTPEIRQKYFNEVISRMEKLTGQSIKEHIVYQRSYAQSDFINDYHAYRGNAYGLANTLFQTAIFKPRLENKKIKNLYYTGQLTVPGPGVPPSLISGEVVANEIIKKYN